MPTTKEQLEAERKLLLTARALYEEARLKSTGASHSLYAMMVRARRESEILRDDLIATEAIEITTLCLRQSFAGHPTWRWAGLPASGQTDLERSRVIIRSILSPPQSTEERRDLPLIFITGGPVSAPEQVIGDLQSWNFRTGQKTLTGLAAGTIQIFITAKTASQSSVLANLCMLMLKAAKDHLTSARFHSLTEMTLSATERGQTQGQGVSGTEGHATTSLTFTYYHQWTLRTTKRPGTFRTISGAVTGQAPEVDAPQGVVLEGDLLSLPLYADEDPEG